MKKSWFAAAAAASGFILCGLALFANRLGLDRNVEWGRSRTFLFWVGILLLALALWIQSRAGLPGKLPAWLGRANKAFQTVWRLRVPVLTILSAGLIIAVYVFFATDSTWTVWPDVTQDYDKLAAAFHAGHLYLEAPPPPAALLAMPDPYDYAARNDLPEARQYADHIWDLTLYKGKVYVYWGPVPSLILAGIKLFYEGAIGDQYVAFGFLVGTFLFMLLLILKIWQRFFPKVPFFLVLAAIFTAGLVCPLPWMLGSAAIYEATIFSGQFFLIGGLYFACSAVEKQAGSYWMLLLATILWSLAAGSRTIILVPAAFLTAVVCLWSLSKNGTHREQLWKSLPGALSLGIPLVVGVLLYGWYNWARFGSVIETGLRYTMTFVNLDKYYSQSFSIYYVPPSLWVYLINSIHFQASFPYIQANYGIYPDFLNHPQMYLYHTERTTGILLCVPFILFSIVSIRNTVSSLPGMISRKTAAPLQPESRALTWISICLAGSGFLTFAAILFYFNVAMRFLADFMPSLMLFSIVGVFQGYVWLQKNTSGRKIYAFAVFCAAVVTILMSLVLAFSQNYTRFHHFNPHFIKDITQFFGG